MFEKIEHSNAHILNCCFILNPTKVLRESVRWGEPTGLNDAGMPEQHQLQKAIDSTLNTVRRDAIRHKAINFVVIRQKSGHAVIWKQ